MSRDELEALQLQRLQHTVAYAYERVPMYKQKFDDAGVQPVGSARNWPIWPSSRTRTRKTCARTTRSACSPCRSRKWPASMPPPAPPAGATVVGYTKGDLERWETLFARSLRASGVKRGWKVHNAYGYGLFTGGLGAHYGAEKLGCTVIPMSGGQTEKQIQLIQDFEPDAILCTPTYLLTIVDAMEQRGIDPAGTSLKVAVLGAEPWTEEMRHELETRMDIDACDIYGLSEVMGPGVAGECVDYKDGSHHLGGPLPPRDHRPADRRGAGRRPGRRAGVHLAHQGSHAGHPLPHPRPHPVAARHRPSEHAPDRPDHRPFATT